MQTMSIQAGLDPSLTQLELVPTSTTDGINNLMLEGKILTKKRFSALVEKKVNKFHVSYLDAILEVCEELEFPVEDAARVITPALKEKVTAEAQRLNMIKDSNTATLPI